LARGTLVSTDLLARHLGEDGWLIFDCRFDLARPTAPEAEYRSGHIPGAHFLSLERDLAGPMNGTNGRHPLPEPPTLGATLARAGLSRGTQVVAYDAQGGAGAARLWWLLRWLGHDDVAVLDGGWQKWTAESRPTSTEAPTRAPGDFTPAPRGGTLAASEVLGRLGSRVLVDARAPDRYRGENETLDPVGGRIPGAVNRFYRDNLEASGTFKSPASLRAEFEALLSRCRIDEVVHYCGSGVTACHNVLAMEHAGFPATRLYPGSWSEWCADPSRPFECG
jgi:thiosulfate/3-mercaptopyruvate sulfurtransferase